MKRIPSTNPRERESTREIPRESTSEGPHLDQGEIRSGCTSLKNLVTSLNEAIAQANSRLYPVLRSSTKADELDSDKYPSNASTEMGTFLECQNYQLRAAIIQILHLIDRVEL